MNIVNPQQLGFFKKNVPSHCCLSFIYSFTWACTIYQHFLALCAAILSSDKVLSYEQMFRWSVYSPRIVVNSSVNACTQPCCSVPLELPFVICTVWKGEGPGWHSLSNGVWTECQDVTVKNWQWGFICSWVNWVSLQVSHILPSWAVELKWLPHWMCTAYFRSSFSIPSFSGVAKG